MAEAPAHIALSSVPLDERQLEVMDGTAALAIRVLTALRERMADAIADRSRIQVPDVLAVIDRELVAWRDVRAPADPYATGPAD
jgi:hypothetical protein